MTSVSRLLALAAIAFGLTAAPALAQQAVIIRDATTSKTAKVSSTGSLTVSFGAGSSGSTSTSKNNVNTPAATSTALTANATTCSTIGGASCTIIYPSTDWSSWTNVTISVTTAGQILTDCLVEWSPDNTNFEIWDSTTIAGLAANSTKSIAISGNSRRFLRIEARSASSQTVTVTITANDG